MNRPGQWAESNPAFVTPTSLPDFLGDVARVTHGRNGNLTAPTGPVSRQGGPCLVLSG